MSNIKIKTTHDAVSPLVRSRPERNRALEVFAGNDGGFSAYVHENVLAFIKQQAELGRPNEAIGLLAGRICQDPRSGPYTLVMAAAEARDGEFQASPSFVRLLPVGLSKLRQRLTEAHPDREIIGWYHTHPHYQPSFSQVDIDEQTHWEDPNQIGIVYGAVNDGEPFGVYRGPDAILLKPQREGNNRAKQALNSGRDVEQQPTKSLTLRQEPNVLIHSPTSDRSASFTARLERLRRMLLPAMAILVLFVTGAVIWLDRRVSIVEISVRQMTSRGHQDDRAQDQAVEPTRSRPEENPAAAGASSPEIGTDKTTAGDSPELVAQTKPLAPTRTPQPQPERRSKAGSRRLKPTQKPGKKKAPATRNPTGTH